MVSLAIGGNLPERMREIIVILLVVFAAAVIGVILAYFTAKAMNIYREHKYDQALARKVLDIEACMIFEEERKSMQQRVAHPTTMANCSLVPSFPPTAYVAPRRTDFHDQTTTGCIINNFSRCGDTVRQNNINEPPLSKFFAPSPAASLQEEPFSWSSEGFSRYPYFPVSRSRTETSPTIGNESRHHHNRTEYRGVESTGVPSDLPLGKSHSDSHVVAPSGKPRLATAVEGKAMVGGISPDRDASTPASTVKLETKEHAQRRTIEESTVETSKHGGDMGAETDYSSLAYYHQE